MKEVKKLEDEQVTKVSGGENVEIQVTIKTLEGENDDYKIPLSNLSPTGNHAKIT